jgi:hypothetical protein
MAHQVGSTKKLSTAQPSGAAVTKSIGTFERSNKVDRADGGNDTNYGRNQYAGSSKSNSVAATHKLSDFDISPPDGDPAQDKLVNQGLAQSKSEVAPVETGQERPISAEPFPPAHGMKNPNANPTKITAALDVTEGQPVRKPS